MNIAEYINSVSRRYNPISFRPVMIDDSQHYFNWFNNPTVRRNLYPQTPTQEDCIQAFLHNIVTNRRPPYDYKIIHLANLPIGHVSIKPYLVGENYQIELGCVIGKPEMIGTGVGLLAVLHQSADLISADPQLPGVYINRPAGIHRRGLHRLGAQLVESSQEDDIYFVPRSAIQSVLESVNFK